MSRIIKFRAWDGETMHQPPKCTDSNLGRSSMTLDGRIYINGGYQDVTLLQFTGLKDKNGVEIYEGDIVKYWYDKDFNWEVYFEGGKFWLRNTAEDREVGDWNAQGDAECSISWDECEVIGNIYEHPNLLEHP